MTTWMPDVLGDDYERVTIPLGADPDGEGQIEATLVRYRGDAAHTSDGAPDRGAVLHVHGFTDYFFQTNVAEHFTRRGYSFYALDLRKCGRSLRPEQTAHYVSDLALYDEELRRALALVRTDLSGRGRSAEVLLAAHSTGGLVVPLWLDRMRRQNGSVRTAGVRAVVLNSPWFDLQGAAYLRSVGTTVIGGLGRARPMRVLPVKLADAYGSSLHRSRQGTWSYDLAWKPLSGFPVTAGWLRAIRRGHAQLHRGLDIGVPSLVLRSTKSVVAGAYRPDVDTADAVLDVRQIARWSGCLGDRTTVVPIEGARHDVFLSEAAPRAAAFAELDGWLENVIERETPSARAAAEVPL